MQLSETSKLKKIKEITQDYQYSTLSCKPTKKPNKKTALIKKY